MIEPGTELVSTSPDLKLFFFTMLLIFSPAQDWDFKKSIVSLISLNLNKVFFFFFAPRDYSGFVYSILRNSCKKMTFKKKILRRKICTKNKMSTEKRTDSINDSNTLKILLLWTEDGQF